MLTEGNFSVVKTSRSTDSIRLKNVLLDRLSVDAYRPAMTARLAFGKMLAISLPNPVLVPAIKIVLIMESV